MKISEIITDKYKLRIPSTVYYELLADVVEAEEEQEPKFGHCNKCDFHADWQPISDGLPNPGLYFITWEGKRDNQKTASRFIELAEYYENYDGDGYSWDVSHIEANGYHDIKIIAWMDLPDKWEGD